MASCNSIRSLKGAVLWQLSIWFWDSLTSVLTKHPLAFAHDHAHTHTTESRPSLSTPCRANTLEKKHMLISAECGVRSVPWCGGSQSFIRSDRCERIWKELRLMSLFYLMIMQTHSAMGLNKTSLSGVKHADASLRFGSSDAFCALTKTCLKWPTRIWLAGFISRSKVHRFSLLCWENKHAFNTKY